MESGAAPDILFEKQPILLFVLFRLLVQLMCFFGLIKNVPLKYVLNLVD